jgi:hypothetical protein
LKDGDLDFASDNVKLADDFKASKQDTITETAASITKDNLTACKILVSNSTGKVAVSTTLADKLQYLDNVTSDINTSLSNKEP